MISYKTDWLKKHAKAKKAKQKDANTSVDNSINSILRQGRRNAKMYKVFFKGWSAEGILRYNELYAMVKEDRKSNRSFTTNWLVQRKENQLDAVGIS